MPPTGFFRPAASKKDLKQSYAEQTCGKELQIIEIGERQLSVAEAVASYLFNSQLLSLDDEQMQILVPEESLNNDNVWNLLQQIKAADNPINDIRVVDLKQSMSNGGGPACLRLRVVLNQQELEATNQRCLMTDALFAKLNLWVDQHYRDRLIEADLADPALLLESRRALDELTQILALGSVYPFQR